MNSEAALNEEKNIVKSVDLTPWLPTKAKKENKSVPFFCFFFSEMFGKHTIQHGSSLPAKLQAQHEGERGDIARRKTDLFKGENKRQRLGLPVLDIKA